SPYCSRPRRSARLARPRIPASFLSKAADRIRWFRTATKSGSAPQKQIPPLSSRRRRRGIERKGERGSASADQLSRPVAVEDTVLGPPDSGQTDVGMRGPQEWNKEV